MASSHSLYPSPFRCTWSSSCFVLSIVVGAGMKNTLFSPASLILATSFSSFPLLAVTVASSTSVRKKRPLHNTLQSRPPSSSNAFTTSSYSAISFGRRPPLGVRRLLVPIWSTHSLIFCPRCLRPSNKSQRGVSRDLPGWSDPAMRKRRFSILSPPTPRFMLLGSLSLVPGMADLLSCVVVPEVLSRSIMESPMKVTDDDTADLFIAVSVPVVLNLSIDELPTRTTGGRSLVSLLASTPSAPDNMSAAMLSCLTAPTVMTCSRADCWRSTTVAVTVHIPWKSNAWVLRCVSSERTFHLPAARTSERTDVMLLCIGLVMTFASQYSSIVDVQLGCGACAAVRQSCEWMWSVCELDVQCCPEIVAGLQCFISPLELTSSLSVARCSQRYRVNFCFWAWPSCLPSNDHSKLSDFQNFHHDEENMSHFSRRKTVIVSSGSAINNYKTEPQKSIVRPWKYWSGTADRSVRDFANSSTALTCHCVDCSKTLALFMTAQHSIRKSSALVFPCQYQPCRPCHRPHCQYLSLIPRESHLQFSCQWSYHQRHECVECQTRPAALSIHTATLAPGYTTQYYHNAEEVCNDLFMSWTSLVGESSPAHLLRSLPTFYTLKSSKTYWRRPARSLEQCQGSIPGILG